MWLAELSGRIFSPLSSKINEVPVDSGPSQNVLQVWTAICSLVQGGHGDPTQ